MAKNKKTRHQKIITQLKRQIQKQNFQPKKSFDLEPSQEAILKKPRIEAKEITDVKNEANSAFSTDLKLIRKDLFKTLIFALGIISFELVLYWKLQ